MDFYIKFGKYPVMKSKRVYYFFGMQRSGSNPLKQWILGHYDGEFWLSWENSVPFKKIREPRFYRSTKTAFPTYNAGMVAFEDTVARKIDLLNVDWLADKANTEPVVGKHEEIKFVMCIRDPFNMYASRLKHAQNYGLDKKFFSYLVDPKTVDLWKQFAKVALGDIETKVPFICLNYNRWFTDEAYRRGVSKSLGLEFNDRLLNFVSDVGSGSSFDKRRFDGNAQKMGVLSRWETFKYSDRFLSLFDDEVRDLSKRLFDGFCPL